MLRDNFGFAALEESMVDIDIVDGDNEWGIFDLVNRWA